MPIIWFHFHFNFFWHQEIRCVCVCLHTCTLFMAQGFFYIYKTLRHKMWHSTHGCRETVQLPARVQTLGLPLLQSWEAWSWSQAVGVRPGAGFTLPYPTWGNLPSTWACVCRGMPRGTSGGTNICHCYLSLGKCTFHSWGCAHYSQENMQKASSFWAGNTFC